MTRLHLGDLMQKAKVREKSSVDFSENAGQTHHGGVRVTPTLQQSLDMGIRDLSRKESKPTINKDLETKEEKYDPVSARFHNNSITDESPSPKQVSKVSSLKKFLQPEQKVKEYMLDPGCSTPYRKIINQSDQAFLSKYKTPNLSPNQQL